MELRKVTLEHLGRAKRVTSGRETTTIVQGGGTAEAIRGRIQQLRATIDDTASEYDREKLRERVAKLGGGVAILRLGAGTESEMKERKSRFEGALCAARAAIAEGIVPGGGVARLRTLPALDTLRLKGDQRYGVDVVRRALEEPLRQAATGPRLERCPARSWQGGEAEES